MLDCQNVGSLTIFSKFKIFIKSFNFGAIFCLNIQVSRLNLIQFHLLNSTSETNEQFEALHQRFELNLIRRVYNALYELVHVQNALYRKQGYYNTITFPNGGVLYFY